APGSGETTASCANKRSLHLLTSPGTSHDRHCVCRSVRHDQESCMIRVATYNIRKCVGLDWRRRPERIMRVLAELKADVVALQEADRRFGERFGTLPVGELHRHTGLRPVQLAGGGRRLGWHGNAILVGD